MHREPNGLMDMERNPRVFAERFADIDADVVICPRQPRLELPGGRTLGKHDAVASRADDRIDGVRAAEPGDLVLFELGADAPFTLAGSLSRGR